MNKVRAIPAGAGVFGLILTLRTLIFSGFRLVPGDPGDTRFVELMMEYSYRWLAGRQGARPYWDLPVFYPVKNALAYSETMLGVAPFYWLWRALGIGPDASYALWLIVMLAATFAAGYLLFRRGLRLGEPAAAASAWLLAFGSPRIAQLNHPQLTPVFWGVLAVYAAVRAWREPGPRPWVWPWVFGGAMALQFYTGFYLGSFFAIGTVLALMITLALPSVRSAFLRALRDPVVRGSWLAAGVVSLLSLAPMASHYLEAAHTVGLREYWAVEAWLPRIPSWFYLGDSSWLYGWLSPLEMFQSLPMSHEQQLGIGLVTPALVLLGLFQARRERPAARIALGVLLGLLVTSTCVPPLHSLWRLWYYTLPGVTALRSVSRIGIFLLLPAAFGLGLWVERYRSKAAILVAGLALVALEQARGVPSFDIQHARATISAMRAEIESKGCMIFFANVTDATEAPWKYQIDAMWAAVETSIPTLNGYSGNFPADWGALYDITVRSPAQLTALRNASAAWSLEHGVNPASVCQVTVPVR
jgi:hypothetical protein